MKVQLKCLSSLSKEYDCDYHIPTSINLTDNSSVKNVMDLAGVRSKDVKIIFVNGKLAEPGNQLSNNDTVTLVPAVGGM
jgi:hypothetical protein